MIQARQDLESRLLYILHWGLVEARNLALGGRNEQIHDLADALETLPGELQNGKEDSLEAIRFNLQTYEDKYRGQSFEYLKYLDEKDSPISL